MFNELSVVPASADLQKLVRGAATFGHDVFPRNLELYRRLAEGQSPHTLFIACADSRVVPELITQTEPGELFVCRNIGNIVPGFGEMMGGVSAVIEYAVVALRVRQIIICGHSECGAMKGLAAEQAVADSMPTVQAWLRNAEAARSVVLTRELGRGKALVQALVEENIRLQLMHLRSHPSVAARLAQGALTVHGWLYDIEHGTVSMLNEAQRTFEPLCLARARSAEGL